MNSSRSISWAMPTRRLLMRPPPRFSTALWPRSWRGMITSGGMPAAWLNLLGASKVESMRDAYNFLPDMGRMLHGARALPSPTPLAYALRRIRLHQTDTNSQTDEDVAQTSRDT